MTTRHLIAAFALLPTLAACSLDKIADPDKKSEQQIHVERMALLAMPGTAPTPAEQAIETAEPPIALQHEVVPDSTDIWPVAVGAGPTCVPEFRVRVCP